MSECSVKSVSSAPVFRTKLPKTSFKNLAFRFRDGFVNLFICYTICTDTTATKRTRN